jgi:Protein of unknown function (DUF2793)
MTAMTTDRLNLPLIASGQAQKEMTHNEALAALDIAVQPVVEALSVDVPPVSPAPGQCWIVGAAPVGAWSADAQALAGWTLSGWRFVTPRAGWTAWVKASGLAARYDGVLWSEGVLTAARIEIGSTQVVATQQVAIENPVGGAVIDSEARATLSSILNGLRSHGLIAS